MKSNSSDTPTVSGVLQRKCDCGTHNIAGGECDSCQKEKVSGNLQRTATRAGSINEVPPLVHEVVSSSGQPLDDRTRSFMESRFNHDFSRVRVHTDAKAAESARAVDALAYTVGPNMIFDSGQYQPKTVEGRQLLAHELTHVLQQSAQVNDDTSPMRFEHGHASEAEADRNAKHVAKGTAITSARSSFERSNVIQRKTKSLGTKVTHPAGSKSLYKSITADFDGQDFIVQGDKKEILKVSAESGRPITVRSADAKSCKGDKDDSYLNNPRYVGITDNGPIPEGEYQFSLTQFATFSVTEQLEMLPGGEFTDPFGSSLHGGDWGAGRAPLTPVKILPSAFCGNTKTRSGFYLHGGSLPGSSGCIDIGNAGINNLIPLLEGYRSAVKVTVKYLHPAPSVSKLGRALGRFTYPGQKNPTLGDRFNAVFGGGED